MREVLQLAGGQRRELSRQLGDPAPPSIVQESFALRRGADPNDTRIAGIALALDETIALQSQNKAGHRRRRNLLGAGQLTNCHRTAEYDDGERGQARRGEPAGVVLLAQAAQQVNRRGVQAIRECRKIVRVAHAS